MPQSLTHYKNATKKLFGQEPPISKKQASKFDSFDKTLDKQNILPRDYAYRLLEYLEPWTLRKGWKFLPVHIFTGKWAQSLYLQEIGNRHYEHVSLGDEQFSMLVMEELSVMKYYSGIMHGGNFEDSVTAMYPFLSNAWKLSYQQRSHIAIHEAAQELYEATYGVRLVCNG